MSKTKWNAEKRIRTLTRESSNDKTSTAIDDVYIVYLNIISSPPAKKPVKFLYILCEEYTHRNHWPRTITHFLTAKRYIINNSECLNCAPRNTLVLFSVSHPHPNLTDFNRTDTSRTLFSVICLLPRRCNVTLAWYSLVYGFICLL